MHRKRRRQAAFSLVEVVVVMAIIAIIAALAAPRFSSASDRFGVKAAARRIVADLDLARAQAINSSASQQVTFDLADESYSLASTAALDRPSSGYRVALAEAPYGSTLTSAFSVTSGTVTVTFDGFGRPDVTGTIVVQRSGNQCVVVLEAGPGRARMQ